MKQLNLSMSMTSLGLGKENDIRESSRLFELAVADFLQNKGVAFYSEAAQKRHIRKNRNGRPFPPTPDFILCEEIIIEKFYQKSNRNRKRTNSGRPTHHQQEASQSDERVVSQQQKVCWIDAKMFYGASTIEHDNKSAVGSLLATARKYRRILGTGAFVFMQGCGDQLAMELEREGVMALDCSGDNAISLHKVQHHQRSWCGDDNGQIWP